MRAPPTPGASHHPTARTLAALRPRRPRPPGARPQCLPAAARACHTRAGKRPIPASERSLPPTPTPRARLHTPHTPAACASFRRATSHAASCCCALAALTHPRDGLGHLATLEHVPREALVLHVRHALGLDLRAAGGGGQHAVRRKRRAGRLLQAWRTPRARRAQEQGACAREEGGGFRRPARPEGARTIAAGGEGALARALGGALRDASNVFFFLSVLSKFSVDHDHLSSSASACTAAGHC